MGSTSTCSRRWDARPEPPSVWLPSRWWRWARGRRPGSPSDVGSREASHAPAAILAPLDPSVLDVLRQLRLVVRLREPALLHPEDVHGGRRGDPALDGLDPRGQLAGHGGDRTLFGSPLRRAPSQALVRVDAAPAGERLLPHGARSHAARALLLLPRAARGFGGALSAFAFLVGGRPGRGGRGGVPSIRGGMGRGGGLGPAVGAFAAARIGFRGSFVVAGFMRWACAAMVAWGTPYHPSARPEHERPPTASVREVTTVCLLVLSGSIQIFFLTAMLPQVLPRLGVSPPMTLEVGGLLLFATGAAAALGSFIAPRLGALGGVRRTTVWSLVPSSVGLAALALASGAWSFGAIRFLQVLCISPVFPLSVAGIAQRASGTAIGIVNASRIAAAFLGPVLATTLLAWMPPRAGYLVLAGLGLSV